MDAVHRLDTVGTSGGSQAASAICAISFAHGLGGSCPHTMTIMCLESLMVEPAIMPVLVRHPYHIRVRISTARGLHTHPNSHHMRVRLACDLAETGGLAARYYSRGRDGALHHTAGRVQRGAARPDIHPADGLIREWALRRPFMGPGLHDAVQLRTPKRLRPGAPHPGGRTSRCGSGGALL